MSKNAKLEKKQGEKHNHKARQLMMQYVITLGVCIGSLALFVILSKLVLSVRVWYPSDSYWPLLHWLNLHIITVCAAIGGAIWLIVTIYYLYRVFRQIDEIVDAAGKMVSWPEKPLEMPRSLEGVQNELNLVREQALRNEMAAKEAEQKKNDLIVYLAHDLKTPLTSVIGYLSLLRDELQISEKLRERYTEIALNKAERLEELINELKNGKNIALVSDAGTPGISDPGEVIVKRAIEENIEIIPIPGACAAINALIVSGLDTKEFVFLGFLPLNKKLRKEKLEEIKNENKTIIIYEAPHKIKDSLNDLKEVVGERKVVLARELTKIHEEFIRGNITEIIEKSENLKGEMILLIEGSNEINCENILNNLSLEEHYNVYEKQGLDKKEIIKKIAKDRGVNKNEIYQYFIEK